MKYSEFIDQCRTTILEQCKTYEYLYAGLKSEIGEVFGKVKKYIRGDFGFDALKESARLEIGDVLWYVAMIGDNLTTGDRTYVHKMVLSNEVFHDCVEPFQECFLIDSLAVEIASKNRGFTAQDEIALLHSCENLAGSFGLTIEECAVGVLRKLQDRKERDAIHGDGDFR